MSGKIFISYRREESAPYAGRLWDRLCEEFGRDQLFMDVDTIQPGENFVEIIEEYVGSCDVLIAVIGRQWLSVTDEGGNRRLENPGDFVRLEIAAALERDVRVIPVLVDGATVPAAKELPEDLSKLSKRNALEVSHTRFRADVDRLVSSIRSLREKGRRKRKRWEAVMAGRRRLAFGVAALAVLTAAAIVTFQALTPEGDEVADSEPPADPTADTDGMAGQSRLDDRPDVVVVAVARARVSIESGEPGMYAVRDLEAGLDFRARMFEGIPHEDGPEPDRPMDWDYVRGGCLTQPVRAGYSLEWDDIAPCQARADPTESRRPQTGASPER